MKDNIWSTIGIGFVVAFLGLIFLGAVAEYNLWIPAEKELQYCVDGDTCYFEGLDRAVRFEGFDTPEQGEEGWKRAKRRTETLLRPSVELEKHGIGKYGRIIATTPNRFLEKALINEGLAVRYE